MRILIAEDDFTSRLLLERMIGAYGTYHSVQDGREAVDAVRVALRTRQPYDLICMDIMMPKVNGHEALKQIRALEDEQSQRGLPAKRSRIIMTTALADRDNVIMAGEHQCDHYLVKPIDKQKLEAQLARLGLIPSEEAGGEDSGR